MKWALIKDNEVKNVIRANADFIPKISAAWDFVVDISELDPMPGIGWAYDGTNFIAPAVPEPPPKTPEQITRREAKERLAQVKGTGNVPIAGQELQNLLKDIIEVL